MLISFDVNKKQILSNVYFLLKMKKQFVILCEHKSNISWVFCKNSCDGCEHSTKKGGCVFCLGWVGVARGKLFTNVSEIITISNNTYLSK